MGGETGTLKQQVARGTAWNGVASTCEMVVGLGTSVLLMRLLAPRDFGLVAAAAVFTHLAHVIEEGGLGSALVQHKDERHLYGSGLIGNLGLVLVTGVAVLALAHPIAILYGEPRLAAIVCWLAVGLVIAGIGLVPQAFLIREMRFRTLAIISTTSTIVAAAVALTLAWRGAGVWALIAQILVKDLTRACMSWTCFPWSQLRGWSWRTCCALLAYGYKAVTAGLVGRVGDSGIRFVMAKLLGTEALGIFAAAWRLVAIPLQALSGPLASAAFPALCRRQADRESLARGYLQMVVMQCMVIGPVTVLLGVSAGHIVPLLTSDRWLAAVPIVHVLAVTALFACAFGASYLVFLAVGKPEYRLFYMLVRTPAIIAGVVGGASWGVVGAAMGLLLGEIVAIPIQLYLLTRVVPISIRGYGWALARPMVILGILVSVSVGILYCAALWGLGDGTSIALVTVCAGICYWLSVRFFLPGAFTDLINILPSDRLREIMVVLTGPSEVKRMVD